MTTSETLRAKAFEVSADRLVVELENGDRHSVSIADFPILADATPQERANWEFIGSHTGIYWPDIDEHISVFSIVHPELTIPIRPQAAARHIQQNRDRRSRSA